MASKPRGATLIELLAVTAVIAALVGILLPAVQRVRLAAAGAACRNNLRQQALGLQQAHDAAGHLPAGMAGRQSATPYQSWRVELLPYLDQQPLADAARAAYAADRNPFRGDRHTPRVLPLAVLGCPTDDRVATAWDVTVFGRTTRVGLSSYLGVAGRDYQTRDGVFYRDSRTRLADITDGTSNTVMLGERPPSHELRFGWWYAGVGQAGTGSLDATLGAAERNGVRSGYRDCSPGPHRFAPGDTGDRCAVFRYWSRHPSGTHFATADGAVRLVTYSAEPTLAVLASRAGGEAIAPSE